MSLPNESVGTGGIAFTTATCVSAWIEYPFNALGDSTTKVYRHIMQVKLSSYAPLSFDDEMTAADKKPTRSPFSDDALAFWVGDSIPTQIGGDLVEFERTFANVPASLIEGASIYSFSYPGLDSTVSSTIATSNGNESVGFDSGTKEAIMTFNVASPGAFSIGQKLHVNNDAQVNGLFQINVPTFGWNNYEINNAFVTNISGSTITCREDISAYAALGFRSQPTITTFTLVGAIAGRDPFVSNATSRSIISYVKETNIEAISIAPKFQAVDSSGSPTDILTTTTSPTKSEYLDTVTSGAFIAAESTQIERWMGNIWAKRIRSIQAI